MLILGSYSYEYPFARHLKTYFSNHRKHGSRDRKAIAACCYAYFRAAALWQDKQPSTQKILHALYLCNQNQWLQAYALHYDLESPLTFVQKCELLQLQPERVFRFNHLLSRQLNTTAYSQSFFFQPHFFMRIRPGHKASVLDRLGQAKIDFECNGDALTIKNGTGIEHVLNINREVVVQDLSSQHVLDYLLHSNITHLPNDAMRVWDVCAASGGKSILLHDLLKKKIRLTVSDNRKTILGNLRKRMAEAGISLDHVYQQDLTQSSGLDKTDLFSIIICDVPCSGSGTWARTPEQHIGFDENALAAFEKMQLAILKNVWSHLTPGGLLFYITCSVFTAENEQICETLLEMTSLKMLHQGYLQGSESGADTMYVAVFSR